MKKKLFIILIIGISLFGLLMVYSSSYVWAEYKFNDPLKYVKNQGLFLSISFLFLYLIKKIDVHIYEKYSSKILLFSILLLILVLIPGIGTVRNGSRSWFKIGPFAIQPSEAAKIALIIFTAKYLSNHEKEMKIFKKGALPILTVTFFVFGLIMLQPDFGTGIIIVMTIIGLLFIGGVPFKFFLKLGILGIGGITSLILVAPYRLKRILSFINPWSDPLGSGFQIIQSLYAIGPGGLFGQGFLNSRQKHFYLPEPQTDFIFAIIAEEFGFLGAILVVGLFLAIIYIGFSIAKNAKDLFSKYLAFGITFGLSFQTILNLMVVVGLIPVTGVTLPFFSYGGSSLLVTMIQMGILLNIYENKI
jgi:cell division protein FtsW